MASINPSNSRLNAPDSEPGSALTTDVMPGLPGDPVYQLVVENSLDFITIWDAQGRTVYDNPAAQRLLQQASKTGDGRPRIGALAHPDDRARIQAEFETLRDAGGSTRIEYRLQLSDGEIRWIDALVIAVAGADGKTDRVIWVRRDITGQRSSTERLRESETRFRQLADNTHDIFLLIGTDGRYQYASPSFYRLFGLEQGDLSAVGNHVHPDDRSSVLAKVRELLTKGVPQKTEYRVILPNGEIAWFEAHAEPVLNDDNQIVGGSVVARDISARRQAEQALTESESRYRLLADNSEDFIQLLDANGHSLFRSPSIARVLGGADDADRSVFDVIVPEDLPKVRQALAQVLNGALVQTIEFRVEVMPGTVRWLEAIGKPVDDPVSGSTMVLAVSRDITKRKRVEEQAYQSQKLEALGLLTGGLAHDFNNLLGVMIGNLDVLEEGISQQPSLLKRLGVARDAALKAAQVTKSLLAVARRQPMVVVGSDLNELVSTDEPLIVTSAGRSCQLSIELGSGPIHVRCDASAFSNALLNLVINARDAMQQVGGTGPRLVIRTGRETIVADSELADGDYGVVRVIDNGSGMPADVVARVFDPFFTTKARDKGTGLGLSMVYGYARQSGGTVRIDSVEGKGTTVTVYLPIASDVTDRADLPAG